MEAVVGHFMHVPHPELLPTEVLAEKYRQFEWLFNNNMLTIQPKKPGK